MFGLDLIASLGGLIIPPAFDFIKKKFLGAKADTPSQTLSTLATTKPEVIPAFVSAQAQLLEAQKNFYNRDVIGDLSRWVTDLRGAIRPLGVIFCFVYLFSELWFNLPRNVGVETFCCATVSSWFGHKLTITRRQ